MAPRVVRMAASSASASNSGGSYAPNLVVWARLGGCWWPARIIDRNGIRHLDTTRTWTSASRAKRIVHFFKQGSTMQLMDTSDLREYTSNMALLNTTSRNRGTVFLACQDANYWIRHHGVRFQRDRVKDPGFLINSVEVRGNLSQVKNRNAPARHGR